ncbi:MAG TPA: sodium:calcium antiporter [Deltaproteobacteria bacterium]|nr:sodium:calcium antiporter [Deltaproteobacteria bacterium]
MWYQFVAASVIIFFAGRYLSDLAEETADITGLSRGFIGALMLGLITSLPELIGTLTAVISKSNPDLGVGNIFGSNLFNIAILSASILIFSAKLKDQQWSWRSNFSAYMSISLAAFLVLLIAMAPTDPRGGFFGNFFILGFYGLGMWMYAHQGGDGILEPPASGSKKSGSLGRNLVMVFLAGTFVVVSGVLLANACDEIARQTRLTSTFVGSLFMAAATSLPELVITMRLLRFGNISMATGNIFGSNAMNLTIVAIADLLYRPSLYTTITSLQLVSLGAGLLMTGIFLSGALVRSSRKLKIQMDNIAVLGIYMLVYIWLYSH